MNSKRDEFSCPCCGVATDSSYCAPCQDAECGEQDVSAGDNCLVGSVCGACDGENGHHAHGCPDSPHGSACMGVGGER